MAAPDAADARIGASTGERVATLGLFFASGFAGLVYQVLWMRELGFLFGSDAYAAATTLAAFFLGIAAGSAAFGRVAARLRRPLLAYGGLEAGVGLTALSYFGLVALYQRLYAPLFETLGALPGAMLAAKFALALGVLFPPAFLMGGTLPVMTQYLVRRADALGTTAALLYAVNTLGAALGAFSAPFVLVPRLGPRGATAAALATTLAVAAVAAGLGRRASRPPRPAAPRGPLERDAASARAPALRALAFLSGFTTLALEVLWTRMFAQVLQNSVYTFSVILVTFLLALAAGAALARELARRAREPAPILVTLLAGGALWVALTPFAFVWQTDGLAPLAESQGFARYVLHCFAAAAWVLGVPTVWLGVLFPYLMKLAERWGLGPGRTVGELAALNTLGAVAGSLSAGFVLLEWLGLWNGLRAIAALSLLAALAVGWRMPRARLRTLAACALGLGLLATALDPTRLPRVALDAEDLGERLVELREGGAGTVAVVDRPDSLRIKLNNHYGLGGSGDRLQEARQAHLPLLLHAQPRSVFFLGLGTGITAGAALQHPLSRVLVAELVPQVVEASRRHFGPWTEGLFDDPRAAVVIEDGRNLLFGSPERFDVIVADLFMPWRAGVGSLYAREHYEAARERLAPGGLYAQWLLLSQLSREEFGSIARTLTEVFPRVTLWRGNFRVSAPLVMLLAERDPAPFSPERIAARLAAVSRAPADSRVPAGALAAIPESPEKLFFLYQGNLSRAGALLGEFPINSDQQPYIEYQAPITHRDKRSGDASSLRHRELLDLYDAIFAAAPPDSDPALSALDPHWLALPGSGLELYRARVLSRLGDAEAARAALARSHAGLRTALGPPGAGGPARP